MRSAAARSPPKRCAAASTALSGCITASHIPLQARALYVRSVFRIIADVAATAVPIVPVLDLGGDPLDQLLSVLRAVSPIHIECLENWACSRRCRSRSSSTAIVGLFACHHYTPRLPGFAQRSAAELFRPMFPMMLDCEDNLRNVGAQDVCTAPSSSAH
jgi:light-regulated signal transduction histidine kinase (bacteriophytochrome)